MHPSIFYVIAAIAAGIGLALGRKKDLTPNENKSKNDNDSENNSQLANERKKGGAVNAEKANVSGNGGTDNTGAVGNGSAPDVDAENDPASTD